jgi:3-methyl-2-oxobutanoate hydroxymethyltransferase
MDRKIWKKKKISMITAYDYYSGQICAEADIDAVLVGDSLGMVIKGEKNTLSVTIEEMIYHLKAVRKGAGNKLFIVCDMPFLSYGISDEEAVKNAGRLLVCGADAVKIEGPHTELIKKLRSVGIPVMGHLGMTPQSYKLWGSMKPRGKTASEKDMIVQAAEDIEKAGAFSIVLEAVPEELGQKITEKANIPIIGIGAGRHTDGQILVWHDVLGFDNVFKPFFAKKYVDIRQIILDTLRQYRKEIKEELFPDESHCIKTQIKKSDTEKLGDALCG